MKIIELIKDYIFVFKKKTGALIPMTREAKESIRQKDLERFDIPDRLKQQLEQKINKFKKGIMK